MSTTHPAWDDVRRIADEVELQIHLASMDARDRWHALQPRLVEVEREIARAGKDTEEAIEHELADIHTALVELRDHVYARARGDYVMGW